MSTLDRLAAGRRARIVRVEGHDAIATRLMEMGVLEGEELELLGRAPWGDPLDIRLQGYRLSLRVSEARRVHIQLREQTCEAVPG